MSEHRLFDCLKKIRRILNRGHFLDSLVFSLFITAFIALFISLGFIGSGYKVDRTWLWLPAGIGFLILVVRYLIRSVCDDKAALHADRFFKLNDSFISALTFIRQNKAGGMYELQEQQALVRIEDVDLKRMRFKPNMWVLLVIAGMIGAVGYACDQDDSYRVKQERAIAALNSVRSEQASEYANESVRETEKDLTEDEKKMFEESEIAKLVKKIKKDPELKNTLKKFSAVDQNFRKADKKYGTKQDEKLLKKMQLALKRDMRTKAIADQLLKKNYKMAANKMREMQIKALSKKDAKKMKMKAADLAKLLKKKLENKKKLSEEQQKDAKERAKELKDMLKEMGLDDLAKKAEKIEEKLNEENLSEEDLKKLEEMAEELAKALEEEAKKDKRPSDEFDRTIEKFKRLRQMAKRMGQAARDDKYNKSGMKRPFEEFDEYSEEMQKLMEERGDALAPDSQFHDWFDNQRRVIRNGHGPLSHPDTDPDWSLL